MSEIPDDIYDAATAAMRGAAEESQENVAWLFTLYCARAILAERERCAKICDAFAKENWGLTELVYAGEELGSLIRAKPSE